jgi:hypothetical protein
MASSTYQPIEEREADVDSEDDVDVEWRIKTSDAQLDEFADVHQSEKEFMKKWNRFTTMTG